VAGPSGKGAGLGSTMYWRAGWGRPDLARHVIHQTCCDWMIPATSFSEHAVSG
jgi:hypothetical protein